MSFHETEVLKILIQSNFQPVPASILQQIPGKDLQKKIDYINSKLNLINFHCHLFKRNKTNYLILTDLRYQKQLMSDAAQSATPIPDSVQQLQQKNQPSLLQTSNGSDLTNSQSIQEQTLGQSQQNIFKTNETEINTKSNQMQNPLYTPYITVRCFLIYFNHETDDKQLLQILTNNSNPFQAKTREELQELWQEHLDAFIIRGMMGKRRIGETTYYSDAGGDFFIKNQDIVEMLNEVGANFVVEKVQESYQQIVEVYKKENNK